MDDFSTLDPTRHMPEWLADEPDRHIRNQVEQILSEQVAGSVLDSFRVTTDPQWLTAGRKCGFLGRKVQVTRAGVAFGCELGLTGDGQTYILAAVLSWVGSGLGAPARRQLRAWLDLDGELDARGSEAELAVRLYLPEKAP